MWQENEGRWEVNQKENVDAINTLFMECIDTMIKKGHDYADNNNCFSNFEFIAKTCSIPTEKAIMVFIAVKIARITQLLEKQETKVGESIEDSLKDIINYCGILHNYLKNNAKN